MPKEATLTNTPADILKYQNDLVRTGNYHPLGRMRIISIAPNAGCPDLPTWDPIMKKWGRLIQLRDRVLPIAQSPDRSMILVTAPLSDSQGRVRLPDLPDPTWVAAPWTEEEVHGKQIADPKTGKLISVPVERPIEKDTPRFIEQKLSDRAEGYLENTDFYVFSPVLSIAFQPEHNQEMLGTFWAVNCSYNPADRTHPALLINAKTGETHFFGGLYDVVRAAGEQ
jgi:hypothetical protein